MKFTKLFLVISVATATAHRRQLQQNTTSSIHNWWEFGLGDPVLDEVALYYLGQSWYQNADVADVLSTVYRVNTSDPWSWTMEWRETAKRMELLAEQSTSDSASIVQRVNDCVFLLHRTLI